MELFQDRTNYIDTVFVLIELYVSGFFYCFFWHAMPLGNMLYHAVATKEILLIGYIQSPQGFLIIMKMTAALSCRSPFSHTLIYTLIYTPTHQSSHINIIYPQMTYDSLLHPIYPCSLRLHRTSSSCGRTRRSHTGTRPPGSEVSGALSSGCSAPWTRPTCPCSPGRRRSSTERGCTRSHCSGTRAGRRWEPCTSLHRWHPRSRRLHHTQRLGPRTSHCGTGNL